MHKPSSTTQIFIDYFHRQFWGNKTGSSGPNSDPALTPVLRRNLRELLKQLEISSLVDAGCGDANLFKSLLAEGDFPHRRLNYLGLECVPALTTLNENFFHPCRFNHAQFFPVFKTADVVQDPLPKADLILCRDVVHYLPNPLIREFLTNCQTSGAKYLLITHNIYSEFSANSETALGVFRPVNLSQKPFCWGSPMLTIDEDVFGKQLALFDLESLNGS